MTRVNKVKSKAVPETLQNKTNIFSDDHWSGWKSQEPVTEKPKKDFANTNAKNAAADDGLWEGTAVVGKRGQLQPRVSTGVARGSEPAGLNQNQDNLSHSSCSSYLSFLLYGIVLLLVLVL